MPSLHIHSGTLLCMDRAHTVTRGDLLLRDGRISAIGDAVPAALAGLPDGRADESYDASGGYVLPGFVHGHLHLCQTLFRGLAEQSDLLRWLRESIWPLEHMHDAGSIAASARLGACELIAGGVTCINDMGTVRHTEVIAATLEQIGLRATVGKALMDQGEGVPPGMLEAPGECLRGALSLADAWHGAGNGRLRVSLAPRFILSCSEGLWREVSAASRDRGLLVHTHIAENPSEGRAVEAAVQATAARYFQRHRLLDAHFVGAHGVWMEPDELGFIRDSGAALVHCPGSNLKLGSGLARVRQWFDLGIRCGIGSDGAPCNNRLDTFAEMSLAAGISRVVEPARALTAREVVELATCRGADALGLGAEIGSLEVGKQADVAVLAVSDLRHGPNADVDPYTTIVHAMGAADAKLTVVAGRILYRDGAWTTLDAERAAADARAQSRDLVRRAEAAGIYGRS